MSETNGLRTFPDFKQKSEEQKLKFSIKLIKNVTYIFLLF